jgi:hypothetical protein
MSIVLQSTGGGSITINEPTTASNFTLSLPAQTATVATLTTPSFATTIGVGGATPTTSGSGISFPATQSASTDANTLDDYEEGTWTPNQGGGLTVSGSYSSGGRYVKIGRLVYVEATQTGSTNIAVAVTGVLCTNLPFAPTTGVATGIGNLTNNDLNKTSSCWVDLGSNTLYAIEAITTTAKLWWSATYYAGT